LVDVGDGLGGQLGVDAGLELVAAGDLPNDGAQGGVVV